MKTITEYTENGSFTVNYNVEILEEVTNNFGTITVGRNNLFGNILFFDGEIQITTYDFPLYHDTMATLGRAYQAENILVVGDGDGGFTQYPWSKKIDYVERDQHIMDIGTKYFNADWNNVRTLIKDSIENVKLEKKYDTILLAITDGFNRGVEELLAEFKQHLTPDGIIVAQVGCVFDVNYQNVLSKYKKITDNFHTIYIPSFFSNHTFAVIKNENN